MLPALDVLEGRCVRLAEGERERVTIEGGDPGGCAPASPARARAFLHLVDLDGAFAGAPTAGLVERVVAAAARRARSRSAAATGRWTRSRPRSPPAPRA